MQNLLESNLPKTTAVDPLLCDKFVVKLLQDYRLTFLAEFVLEEMVIW